MADANDKVLIAKTALMTALADNASKYLANLKLWFRYKYTKEQFDHESRKLLTADKVHLHNQFFVAILNKIDAFSMPPQLDPNMGSSATSGSNNLSGSSSRSNRKRKRSSRTHSDRATFEQVDILDYIGEDNMESIRPPLGTDPNVQLLPTRYCVQELFLPDTGFVLGRFLIGAWEIGLVNVDEKCAEYVAKAVKVLLKDLISAIIMKRKHYKVTGEGSFYYDIGAPFKSCELRNTVTRQKVDDGPLELDKEITSPNFMRRSNDDGTFLSVCEDVYPQKNDLITLRDVQRAFGDRNLIASHSIYAINMERITQMMK